MGTEGFIGWQFGMTLIVVLVIAAFMLWRVRHSQKKRGELNGPSPLENRQTAARDTAPRGRP